MVALLHYDAVDLNLGDVAYNTITDITKSNLGKDTPQGCATNSAKTCRWQGTNPQNRGLSFTFGCSNSIYNHCCCKFSRSASIRKIKLGSRVTLEEERLEMPAESPTTLPLSTSSWHRTVLRTCPCSGTTDAE